MWEAVIAVLYQPLTNSQAAIIVAARMDHLPLQLPPIWWWLAEEYKEDTFVFVVLYFLPF